MADKIDDAAEKPMSVWSRVLIGTAGVGLSVAGLIAMFVKDTNVAGVPLLIVAGAAFLYVALTGQRLIQVSKDGVTFGKFRGPGKYAARSRRRPSHLLRVERAPRRHCTASMSSSRRSRWVTANRPSASEG